MTETELYQQVYHSLDVPILVIEVDEERTLRFAALNSSREQMMGSTAQALIGQALLPQPPASAALHSACRQAVDGGEEVHCKECFTVAGRPEWWSTRLLPLRTHSGVIHRILASSSNITREIAAEQALSENEDMFASIAQSALDAIIMIDDRGQCAYWNPAAERIFGYRPEEVLGKNLHLTLAPQRFHEAFKSHFPAFTQDGSGMAIGKTLQLAALRKDGSEFPIELSVSAFKRQDHWHAVGILRDISERIAAQAELQKSLTTTQAILENLPVGVVLVGRDKIIRQVNRSGLQMMGRDAEQVVGQICHHFICPAEQNRCPVCDLGQKLDNSEKTLLGANGLQIPILKTVMEIELNGEELLLEAFIDYSKLKQAEQTLQHTNRSLYTLSACNQALVRSTDESTLFHSVCEALTSVGNYPLAWIGEARADTSPAMTPIAVAGIRRDFVDSIVALLDDDCPACRAIHSDCIEVVHDIANDPHYSDIHQMALDVGFRATLSAPLHRDGVVWGTLNVCSNYIDAFDANEISLLEELAGDIDFGCRTLAVVRERDQAHLALKKALMGTIEAVALTVEKRDPYTAGHQRRVAELAVAIGREMGLEEQTIEGLRIGGIVHDIGKITIPAEYLARPGRLTEAEFTIIKTHSSAGYEILQGVESPWPIQQMILQHHERLDGSGYPQGLKGEQIVVEARILAVADVVEAMASHRPYRPARGVALALNEIVSGQGQRYDAEVVAACLRLFNQKGYELDGE